MPSVTLPASTPPTLVAERDGRILVATLSRPPVNALDEDLLERLEALVAQVCADPDIAVLRLRSGQDVFCAGADLALMQRCFADAEGRAAMLDIVRRMQRLFASLEAAPVVTLAEVGGAALGGGLELALACDLRVAADDATLGLPEARLGLLPAAGGTQRLTRLCGEGVARRLILGAEIVDGIEAQRLGLVQWARPRAELAEWTRALAARIAAMPRAALAAGKACVHAANDASRDGYALELAATQALYDDPESQRRVAEFLAHRSRRLTGN
ncbi:MAG: enoyl-CoA hydratase/isomerase family protein [Burkholderiales bacterium]|nr:enoyl-CoA hydratase/isomerase family protein [Burkholderiales bacterium]